MRLHHFTTDEGRCGILADGVIRPTWPGETSDNFPEGVVWLSSDPDPEHQAWKNPSELTTRITVELADPVPWSEWRKALRHHPAVDAIERWTLSYDGGDPDSWWIAERPIQADEFVAIETFPPPPPPRLLRPDERRSPPD